MNYLIPLSIVSVGLLNIGLNIMAKKTAMLDDKTYSQQLLTPEFLFTFLIGMASLLGLLFVYKQEVNLPQAIALMGGVSIVLGALITSYCLGEAKSLAPLEWILVACIAALLLFRFCKGVE